MADAAPLSTNNDIHLASARNAVPVTSLAICGYLLVDVVRLDYPALARGAHLLHKMKWNAPPTALEVTAGDHNVISSS